MERGSCNSAVWYDVCVSACLCLCVRACIRALSFLGRFPVALFNTPFMTASSRSAQVERIGQTSQSAPEYLFVISELAGERRFASVVAKRLESMVCGHHLC